VAAVSENPQALAIQAQHLAEHLLHHPDERLADVGYSLATTRTHFGHRATLATTGMDIDTARQDLLHGLHALTQGQPHPTLTTTGTGTGKTVFVFGGQGSQHPTMGRDLYHTLPVFREALDACDQALYPYTGWSVLDVLHATPGAPPLERVDVVQPALFAVMTALAVTIRHYGIAPDAVIGHSQGEITAAHLAGALSLDDAAKIVALRSQALTTLTGHGAMAAVWSSPHDLRECLSAWDTRISIAAINSPTTLTLTGDPTAITELLTHCTTEGIWAHQLDVNFASHCSQVETIRDQLLAALADITPHQASVPFYSTVHGQPHDTPLDTTTLDADYWYRNLRHTIDFHDTTHALLNQGHTTFLEISPHPLLTPAIIQTHHRHTTTIQGAGQEPISTTTSTDGGVGAPVPDAGSATPRVLVTGLLHKDHPGPVALAGALARLHTHGVRGLGSGQDSAKIELQCRSAP
jgi:acyl transferase domain-containing protein